MLSGVDVSSFQGEPAQWRQAAGDIDWAAVKITELGQAAGAYLNPDAAADWAWLKQQGKIRIAYLFGHPATSAADTVTWFGSRLTPLGVEDGDGIALDLEVTDGLGPAAVAFWSGTVLSLLHHEFGRTPLLYTFRDFPAPGNCAGLGGWPLWIADPSSPAGHPAVPAPWKTWAAHQWGIRGIDRDIAWWPSPQAMRAAIGRPVPLPPPAPETITEPRMILVQVDRATVPPNTPWPGVFLLASDGSLHHVTTPADVGAYKAAGIPGPVTITFAEYQARTAK